MQQHYENHYSANLMTLAVYGKEPNSVLKEWVVQFFSPVCNKKLCVPTFTGSDCSPCVVA